MATMKKNSLRDYQKRVTELLAPVRHPQLANLIALMEEVGELCREIMNEQIYKDASAPLLRNKLEPELADILMTLLELGSNYGVDLQEALDRKLEKIRHKIPSWTKTLGPVLAKKRKQFDT